jgi:DNA-binding SARP family transcriptional activator/Flp pilus assembly protein TadD
LSVTRLRSKGLVGVLDRQDLLFTEVEVKLLFADVLGGRLDQGLIHQLHQSTHGWATGLQLIAQAVEQRYVAGEGSQGDSARLLEVLKQSEEEIFDYFAEEVFQHESPERQDAMLRLSVFKHIDPATASCVLPAEEAYQMLASLQRRNLFISHVEDGSVDEYSFHPMFRRFLRRRLKAKLGEPGLQGLLRQYGDHLMQLGKWQKAGLLYAEARDNQTIARIMVEHGQELLEAGLFEIIKRGYQTVAESVSDLHPEIIRLRAHIARMEGDLELAARLFDKAAAGARDRSADACEAAALHGLAATLIQQGQHGRAHSVAREALEKSPATDYLLQAQCEHVLGNCQFLKGIPTGQFDEAIQTWRRGVELAQRAGNDRQARIISHNIGLPYAFTGDLRRAREWFAQLVEGTDPRVPFPQQALAYCNLSRADLEVGDFDSCEHNLEKAMEVCRLFNLTMERAEAHEMIGNLQREREQFKIAREHYAQAEDLYRDARLQVESRELPDEQLRLLVAEGNLSRARDRAEKLLEKRASLGYAVPLARSRLLLAAVLMETGAGDPRDLLGLALSQFTSSRSHALVAETRLLLARAEHHSGDEEAAADHLTEALKLARQFDYSYRVKSEARRHPIIFQFALARGIESDYLKGLGVGEQGAGVRGQGSGVRDQQFEISNLPALPADPRTFDLSINLLGSAEVFREQGRRLAPDAWTLSRALKILCFIASRQNRRATKDSIIEAFWPDTPPEDIDKNFWPTISHIRRALNSNQGVKKNFIRYRESAYYLNPEFSYRLDTEEFERLISMARARRREGDGEGFTELARRAIELYRGDFVEEFYDSWADEQRSYYRNIYFATLKDLADYYHRTEKYERSIAYCHMILKRDPYREDVHRQLMDAYARTGNRVALRQQFEGLKELLMEELGVDPLPETVATYKKLVGAEGERA